MSRTRILEHLGQCDHLVPFHLVIHFRKQNSCDISSVTSDTLNIRSTLNVPQGVFATVADSYSIIKHIKNICPKMIHGSTLYTYL